MIWRFCCFLEYITACTPLRANEGSLYSVLFLSVILTYFSICTGYLYFQIQLMQKWVSVHGAVPLCIVSLPIVCVYACLCLYRSPHCIYLIMRRGKRLWDNSIFCSNWSFHLRAVLSNLISDKSVSHLQLNCNIELAFRLSSLVLVSSPPTACKMKKKKNPKQWPVVPFFPCRMKQCVLCPWIGF